MIASLSSFTPEARQVLVTAQDEARTLGHGYIGTEHLLIALLVLGTGTGVERLTAAGISADDARNLARGAFEATGRANPYIPDDEVLASVGVDLDAVRRRTEAAFGSGALPGRVGSPPFTARARRLPPSRHRTTRLRDHTRRPLGRHPGRPRKRRHPCPPR